MKEFQDLFGISEDERILVIGKRALVQTLDLALEANDPAKIARYITKVTERFPGVRHIETRDTDSPLIKMVRFGPTVKQMMGVRHINRAPVLDQLEGQWEKIVAALVYKLARDGVVLTFDDIKACGDSGLLLFAHGHFDSYEFKMVTKEAAEKIAAHQATQGGKA